MPERENEETSEEFIARVGMLGAMRFLRHLDLIRKAQEGVITDEEEQEIRHMVERSEKET